MIDGKTAEIIRDLAQQAKQSETVTIGYRKKAVFLDSVKVAEFDIVEQTAKVQCFTLEHFVRTCDALDIAQVFVGADGLVGVQRATQRSPQSLVSFTPQRTAPFAFFDTHRGKVQLSQRDFVATLRTEWRGHFFPPTLQSDISSLRVSKVENSDSEVKHDSSKMGRDISMSAMGATELPDEFTLKGTVFRQWDVPRGDANLFVVDVVLQLDFENAANPFILRWDVELVEAAKAAAIGAAIDTFDGGVEVMPAKLLNPDAFTA